MAEERKQEKLRRAQVEQVSESSSDDGLKSDAEYDQEIDMDEMD